ncbi:MAG: NUDIX domain-containing protein, partial [Leuconostoc mesenteroides]
VTLTNMCMVYDDKGNVLVEEKAGGLIFPGGHVENVESIVDSTIREIKEETGLTISELEFCGIKDWLEKDGSRYLVFLYKTNKFSGKLIPSDEGDVYWLLLEELKKKEPLWHLDKMLEIFCGNGVNELYFDGTDVMLK